MAFAMTGTKDTKGNEKKTITC